jgi:hypothetical protein
LLKEDSEVAIMNSYILSSPQRAFLGVIGLLACGLFTAEALGTSTVDTEAAAVTHENEVVWVAGAPRDLATRPVEAFQGDRVYLVDGQWQFRSEGRWVAYRREPAELAERRLVLEGAVVETTLASAETPHYYR